MDCIDEVIGCGGTYANKDLLLIVNTTIDYSSSPYNLICFHSGDDTIPTLSDCDLGTCLLSCSDCNFPRNCLDIY